MPKTILQKIALNRIFNKYSIWKILILFYVLFIVSLGVSIYLIDKTANKITKDYKDFTNNTVTKLNLLTEIRKNIFIAEDATLKHIFLTDNQQMSQEKSIISAINNNQESLIKYNHYISTNQEQKLYNELLIKRIKSIKSRERILYLSTKNKDKEAVYLYNKTHIEDFNEVSNLITTLINLQIVTINKQSDSSNSYVFDSVNKIKIYVLFSILIILIIGFLICLTFKRMVNDNKTIRYQKRLSEALLESGPDAIVGLNENEEIILFNKQAENIFEYERNEVINKKNPFQFNKINSKGIKKSGEEFQVEINKSQLLNDGKVFTLYSIRDISEKFKNTQLIKEKEKKYRNIFENSFNAIIISNGVDYLDCNNKALKLFGVKTLSDFIKHKTLDFSPEFQLNGMRSSELIQEYKKETEKGHFRYEWLIKNLDGKLFLTEILVSYYISEGEKIYQFNINDITDRKKTENFIEQINKAVSVKTGKNYFSELTHFLINYTKVKYVFIGSYNPENNTIETISFRDNTQEIENAKFEIIDSPCSMALDAEKFYYIPDEIQSIFPKNKYLKSLNVNSYLGFNLKLNDKKEGIIVLMDDKPMNDIEEKKKVLSFLTARSINELKQRSIFKKLKESKEFNKGILSSLKSQIAVINDTGEIIAVNNAWKQFALKNGGESPEKYTEKYNYIEVCKKSAAAGDEIAKEVLVGIQKIFSKELNKISIEYPCHSPTEERWFVFSAMPFGKNENKIVITHRNVTDRKRSEQKQEIQNLELKKTNSELDQFVYSISHDLRAPLTSMLGLIDISYDCEKEERPELLGMMKQTVVKLDDLITDILIYSRNKNTLIVNEEIDFQNLLETTRNNHLYMDGTENISINLTINQKNTFVSDKIRITYILNNLYSNAIKYADTTKSNSFVNITITTDENNATITFEDNGIGIAESDNKKIFEMFYRSTNLSTGSGLGLYILNESIEKMNGKINLKSEIGQGSTFTISIPNVINQ